MAFFFAALFFLAFSVANAQDNNVNSINSRISASSLPLSIFYEDQIARPRDAASQTPVSLEEPIDSNYIVGPGDFFEILLPNGTEGVQVSPEGTIAIQGFGLIEVNGLKLHEAKEKILERLKTRYDMKFTGVHLVQLRSFAVNVQGAVFSPGQIVVNGQARAKSAIYAAGNFRPAANRDSIYVHRKGTVIATTENILLQAGDIIEVPYKEWRHTVDVIYAGKVTTVPHIPNRTLKDYIKEAGISVDKNYTQISIKNEEAGFAKWVGIDQIDHILLEPLSEIEFHLQAPFVYVGGAVAMVGKVPYNSSMSAADYVAASGVSIITGDFSRVTVLRNGKKVSVDWAKGEILPGDFIEIPRTVYEQVKDVTIFATSLLGIIATVFILTGR